LLLAIVTAAEVSGRLAANLVNGPQQGHMRAFIHRVGGATSVSKICRQDEVITAQALAIALSMPEYPLYPSCFSPDTKVICTSSPTVGGVKAAFMAAQGMDGPLDIIENPIGFFTNFSYNKYVPDIWKWIGETWTLRSLSVKKYATCGYAQGSVSAAIGLKKSYTFSWDEIIKVNVYVPIVTLIMEKFSAPHFGAGITTVNTHFSTIRSVAAALIFGELTGDFYRAGTFKDKRVEIQKLQDRIYLHHDWQLTILSMRGIDAGLANAGKPGFLSLGGSRKTFKKFKKAFGSRSLLQWKDLFELARIPRIDLFYFLRRYFKSISFSLLKSKNQSNLDDYYSHEADLSKMQFNVSGRVEISFKDGKTISGTCILPPGFADDPERGMVVQNKFMREATLVWGETKSQRIMDIILNIEKYTISQLCAEIKQL
jgi:2-methylcitrate dehydratase PrpD